MEVVDQSELDGVVGGDEGVDESERPRLVDGGFELLVRDQGADRQAGVVLGQWIRGEGQCEQPVGNVLFPRKGDCET